MVERKILAVEHAFYRFAAMCFRERLDVIFKGGCLLRHILRSVGKIDIRGTKDIDFDMSELDYLRLDESYRELIKFGRLRSGSKCNVVLLDGNFDCDVQILQDIDPSVVRVYKGESGAFYGVCVEDMLADKIASMSGRHIIERAKDVVDIYRISTNLTVDLSKVRSLCCRRNIEDFSIFRSGDKRLTDRLVMMGCDSAEAMRVSETFVAGILADLWQTKALDREDLAVIDYLLVARQYKDLPIIVAGESTADIYGWTSACSALQYIGDPKYALEAPGALECLGTSGYVGKGFLESGGVLRFAGNIETLVSLVEFDCQHWGLKAICNALRWLYPDVDWLSEIRRRGLEDKLVSKLELAVELGEDDEQIFQVFEEWRSGELWDVTFNWNIDSL